MTAATRWRIDLEYDGGGFAGWQVQPGQRTVQGEVEAALEPLLGHTVRVRAAGRTDAGVHARQQVASFVTTSPRNAGAIRGGLNARLGDDVACTRAVAVPEDFDPRHSPHVKLYRYRWLVRAARSPLRAPRVWHLGRALAVEQMAAAAAHLAGTHDFSAFRATGCAARHPVRTLDAIRVLDRGDEVHLEVEGTGFLRHMVRIVAGTLVEVGRGRRPTGWLAEVLAAGRRDAAGRTAPAQGLVLVEVRYGAIDGR